MNKLKKEFKEASKRSIWEAIRDNFIYGFLGATLVVFITVRSDIAVLIGYLCYYFFLGKIVNRPKYVTSLGKFIMFPIPTALGAFIGYKISQIITTWL